MISLKKIYKYLHHIHGQSPFHIVQIFLEVHVEELEHHVQFLAGGDVHNVHEVDNVDMAESLEQSYLSDSGTGNAFTCAKIERF
jgi:hypothetical protein